jgi:hypothetical protein
MSKLKLAAIFLFIIWFYKLSYNAYCYFRTKSLFKRYKKYEQDKDPLNVEIAEILPEVKELFTRADIKDDVQIPFDNSKAKGKIKPLWNIANDMPEIQAFYNVKFVEVMGFYRKGMIDSINPFYWVNFFVYIPQKVLSYINVVNEIVVKIINLIYWIGILILVIKNIF